MSQQTSPEPKNWTIAYRKPRANRFVRAANWAGTWAEAVELSGRFGEIHPDMQVWYTSTRQAELDGYVTVEDIANILTDSGKRIRVVEGELAAEDLAAMISPEADEAHAVLDHGISYDGRNSYPTPPVYLAPRAADSLASVGDKVIFDSLQAKVVSVYPASKTNPYAKVLLEYEGTGNRETVARDSVRRDNWDRILVLSSLKDGQSLTAEQETEYYQLLGERYDRDGSHNLREPVQAGAGQAVCAGCGERIFRHQDGTWDLVEKLQDNTRTCFIRDGQPDQLAYEDRQPHVPLTASGYDEGTPHFEVYVASPGGYDTKKHPTFIAQSMAEHNARRYSRDGRAYVVEGVGADGKRTKVAVFRGGRKVRQS